MSRLIKTFTAVPKELFRVNNGTSVTLRDRNIKKVGSYDLLTEGGKVKPKALDPKSYAAPNGASLRPNTSNQNRLVQSFKGSNTIIYAIPSGIKLPDDLVLVHEYSDHYSLQAAQDMTLEEINTKITNFLNEHAEKFTKEQWLKKYPEPEKE
ncbi:MAG: hypothetical protein Q9163_005005 [Psora crenata]